MRQIQRQQGGTKLSSTDAAIVTVALRRAGGLVATFDRDFRRIEGISSIPD